MGRMAVKLWKPVGESYKAGDRVFAILQRPEVALLLTCDAPGCWTAMVFDFVRKQAVASARNQPSCSEAQKYALEQLEKVYQVVAQTMQVQWQHAINRPDMLQT